MVLESAWCNFGGYIGVFLGSHWDRFRIVLELFWNQFVIILGPFVNHFGIIVESDWDRFGIVLGYVLPPFFVSGVPPPLTPIATRRALHTSSVVPPRPSLLSADAGP